jgi:hypothetical protein
LIIIKYVKIMADTDKVIAYCVKCRKKQEMKDAKEVQMKGKGGPRRALKGVCPVCGTGMFRILGKA